MQLENLIKGTFVKRYKRFMTDVILENGETVTAHCPNSGRMTGCYSDSCKVLLSKHNNPKRKLKYTLELTSNDKTWIVVNTNRANELVYEAVNNGIISELNQYFAYKREVKYGENSRIDILCEGKQNCWVEVKSVTMLNDKNQYCFPDAPTTRGQKHLTELMHMVENGDRAVMFFMILREDGNDSFTSADFIDPQYGQLLRQAADTGVELIAYKAKITDSQITIDKTVKIDI